MEEFLGKVSLYDVVARLLAGGLAISLAYFSNLLNVVGDVKEIPIAIFLLCSYGVGIVLEEISYKCKKEHDSENDKEIMALLITDNREDVSEYPLAQMVLADSLKIACIIIALWKIIYVLCICDVDYIRTVINIVILGVLCVIFHWRKVHYKKYRAERINEYYNAKMAANKSVESE